MKTFGLHQDGIAQRFVAFVAAVLIAFTVIVASDGTASAARAPLYDALGDSYTAQDGNTQYNQVPCELAPSTYPSIIGATLGMSSVNLACSGANTFYLLASTMTNAQGPQAMEISTSATVVTILIGINDLGPPPFQFLSVLSSCEDYNATIPGAESCQTQKGMDGTTLQIETRTAIRNLAYALEWIHQNRPRTKVYLLDYPAIIGTSSCTADENLTSSDISVYNSVLSGLNGGIKKDAKKAGVGFIDLYKSSLDKNGCPMWIAPGTVTAPAMPLHPTPAGVEDMAAMVAKNIKD